MDVAIAAYENSNYLSFFLFTTNGRPMFLTPENLGLPNRRHNLISRVTIIKLIVITEISSLHKLTGVAATWNFMVLLKYRHEMFAPEPENKSRRLCSLFSIIDRLIVCKLDNPFQQVTESKYSLLLA